MSRRKETITPDYFETLYESNPDPWHFATSDYERDKYADTLAALPEVRYARALEVGCAIGVFTRQLAPRCGKLLSIDAAEAPLAEARRRCVDQPNVEIARMFVPGEWPPGRFNLIVLSEVVYYLHRRDVVELASRVYTSLEPRACVALVHWTGETDYPLSGDEAADLFLFGLGERVETVRCDRRPAYRLDIVRRSDLLKPA